MQAYWVVVGEIVGIALSWWLVSRKLKKLGDETDSITVPDVLAAKFQDKWHLVRGVAVLIILVMVTTYVTAQMVASGKAFSSFLRHGLQDRRHRRRGIHHWVYVCRRLQGRVLYRRRAGRTDVAGPYRGADSSHYRVRWVGRGEALACLSRTRRCSTCLHFTGKPVWIGIASFVAVGLPFLGVPQLLIRYMSARDDMEIRKARVVSLVVLLIFTAGAVTAGVAGRALYPGLDDPETIFPVISNNLFPPIIAGMLLVVVLSAIMSTVDSLLLLASSSVVRDTYQKIMGSNETDARLASYGKIVTIVIGAIAVVLGIQEPRVIFHFVLASWSGLGSAFGPVILGILYYKRITWEGVLARHVRRIPGERRLADLVQGRLPRPVRGHPGFHHRIGADLWCELPDQRIKNRPDV